MFTTLSFDDEKNALYEEHESYASAGERAITLSRTYGHAYIYGADYEDVYENGYFATRLYAAE